jgi:hypothetical protein
MLRDRWKNRPMARVLGTLLREIEIPGELSGGGEHLGPLAAVRLRARRDDLSIHP